MCTLVVLHRPEHPWPLVVAGNRDEVNGRPWQGPARHWPDRPEVVAGLDEQGGGSWLGLNDHGVVAAVMNREGTLGPAPHKRSRGELVLEALDHAEAAEAVDALADLEPASYREFNLFVGDPRSAFWLRHGDSQGARGVEVFRIPPGLHMLASADLDDTNQARIRLYLPRFRAARAPDPDAGRWEDWQALLASRLYPQDSGPATAMNFIREDGFGTQCSHLVAVPRYPGHDGKPRFLFAAGPPDQVPFQPVST